MSSVICRVSGHSGGGLEEVKMLVVSVGVLEDEEERRAVYGIKVKQ